MKVNPKQFIFHWNMFNIFSLSLSFELIRSYQRSFKVSFTDMQWAACFIRESCSKTTMIDQFNVTCQGFHVLFCCKSQKCFVGDSKSAFEFVFAICFCIWVRGKVSASFRILYVCSCGLIMKFFSWRDVSGPDALVCLLSFSLPPFFCGAKVRGDVLNHSVE